MVKIVNETEYFQPSFATIGVVSTLGFCHLEQTLLFGGSKSYRGKLLR